MSGIANRPSSSAPVSYWTMDISINNSILTTGGSSLYWTMPHSGTLVDMFVTAQGTVDDTGHIFVTIGDSSVGFAFLASLAAGDTISALQSGIDNNYTPINAAGVIATNTAVVVSFNGLTNASAPAEVNLQLIFSA